MRTIIKAIRLAFTAADEPELTITLKMSRKEAQTAFQGLQGVLSKGKLLEVTIEKQKRKRSLDSNAYLWIICQKIAEVTGSTKELVYREFIKRVGQFEIVPLKNEAVEKWIQNWQSHGIGWVSEVMGDSKIDGYTNVISYYGSSCYDSRSMGILLDEIVGEAKSLGIEVLPENEIKSLLDSWNKKG
jgi:hypothetical protein